MHATIQQWGNSIGLRIPKGLAQDAKLVPGSPVDLRLVRGNLVVVLVGRPGPSLRQMLARVTPQNIHGESFPRPRIGKEVIE